MESCVDLGRLARGAGKALLPLWAAAAIAVGATLMAGHTVSLPVPSAHDPRFASALNQLRLPAERHSWLLVHFLYGECRCSERVLAHLLARGKLAGMAEKIVLIGQRPALEARARASGFDVSVLSAEELARRFRVESAPLLAVVSERGALGYVGGYSERKQAADVRDLAILSELRRGRQVEPLPLFGCAVSRDLQRELDPLAIKYDQKG